MCQGFSFNLISASRLVKDINRCLILIAGFCIIQDLTRWRMIGIAKEVQGLYHLIQGSAVEGTRVDQHTTLSANVLHPNLWHLRLGHPSVSRLELLHSVDSSIPLPLENEHCDVCHLAKQVRLPFPSQNQIV